MKRRQLLTAPAEAGAFRRGPGAAAQISHSKPARLTGRNVARWQKSAVDYRYSFARVRIPTYVVPVDED